MVVGVRASTYDDTAEGRDRKLRHAAATARYLKDTVSRVETPREYQDRREVPAIPWQGVSKRIAGLARAVTGG